MTGAGEFILGQLERPLREGEFRTGGEEVSHLRNSI